MAATFAIFETYDLLNLSLKKKKRKNKPSGLSHYQCGRCDFAMFMHKGSQHIFLLACLSL